MRKHLLFYFLFIIFILILPNNLSAQQFGGNPPSLKWKQLNSDTARIIYPEGLDSTAQRVASVVHFLAAKNNTLGNQLHKINIVLQNQSTIANGYVGLGPFRSEFLLTPSPNNFSLGSIDWATGLAVHEYRHVQQYNNFRKGLSKLFYYLFGEEGLTFAINAAVPDWFYEGDAVYNETVHTEQGRGRIPFFTNEYRSLWQANKNYNWMKMRNGSLKDYVPNHYALGYLMVNYGYEKYGTDFWKKVTGDAAAFKGLVYPFQQAIKKQAGIDYKTFRKEGIDFYKQNSVIQYKSVTQGTPNQGTEAGEKNISVATKAFVTNYYFPYQLGNDSLLYLKSSYRRRPAFVIKDADGEHMLRVKDISNENQFSYRNGLIVYAAYKPDARWGWRDYGEIRLLDVQTGKQKTLTHKTKYFSPDISFDGGKIVAVNISTEGKSELHILDARSGEVLQRISSSEIGVFTDPKFIDENSLVTAVRLHDGRMALALVKIDAGSVERLTPLSFNVIGFLNVDKGMVYFTGSYSGNDDVFALDLASKKVFQVTNGTTGNYFVNVKDGKVLYSNFTADGYQLKQINIPEFKRNEVNGMNMQEMKLHYPIAKVGDYTSLQLSSIPGRNFIADKYKKGIRLLNFHSWRPYYEDPEFTFTLYGENVLNTLETEIYYLYNQDERTNAVGVNAVYGALFPYITSGTEYTFRRTDTVNNKLREWNQLDTRIGLAVPLDFSGGRFFRQLNIGSSFILRNENNTGVNKNLFAEKNFTYLSHYINYSQQVQKARQHIFPKWGGSFSIQHRHAISEYNSYQFFNSGKLYLPGIASTHSIVLSGSFQQRDTLRQLFTNRFSGSRGYSDYYFSRMWRVSGNYHLPLLIPDWGFGNILYIQRIRANAFYDFTKVYSRNKKVTRDQRSTGMEFYFDTNWWNQYPLTFGFRISKLLDNDLVTGKKGTVFEFVLPVSILPK